jgi:hypothetical protein
MSEHDEQAALIQWRDYARRVDPRIGMLFAIPNGGARSKRTAGRLKAEGAAAGVPDLCLPVATATHGGLWIELKTASGRVRPEQQTWIDALNAHGQCAGTAATASRGADTCASALRWRGVAARDADAHGGCDAR